MAIKFFNSIEVYGEVQGSTLDINGNADILGDLAVEGAIYQQNNHGTTSKGVYVPMVQGGMYATSTSTITGRLRIKVPAYKSDQMQTFYIDVYEYDTDRSATYRVSGYNYSDTNATWYNTSVVALFDSDNRDLTVRFGADTSASAQYVAIGEVNTTWSYPQVVIRDYASGYNTSVSEATGAFTIEFVTTDGATYNVNHDNNQPYANWSKIESIPSNVTNALPTTGGTMSGAIAMGSNNITGGGTITGTTLTGTSLDINGAGDVSGTLTVDRLDVAEYLYHEDDNTYIRFLPDRILAVASNNTVLNLNVGADTIEFGHTGKPTTLQGSSLAFTGAATFNSTIGSGAITSTGKITGTELEGTSLDINGDADIAGSLHIRKNAGTLNLVGTDHSYIQWYPDGTSAGRKAYTGYGGATDNNFSIVNEISGGNVKINTNGGAIELLDNTVVTGELEATSLDINGNADISGTLDVHGDLEAPGIYVGATNTSFDFYNNGTSYLNGATTVDANLSITAGSLSITADGSNATVMSESGSGDFEINTVGDIILDAGGGDITLRDDGTTFGELEYSGGNFNIVAKIQDSDIKFYGNDGGSSVTALTLDMSEGGNATFAGNVTVGSNSLTAGSLDINGNADISGNLTGLSQVNATTYIIGGHTINDIDRAGEFVDSSEHILTSAAAKDYFAQINANTTGSSGSCTGNADSATTLASSREFLVDLASTSAVQFNGEANCSPGVTGTLAVGNGGTGLTSISTLLNSNVTSVSGSSGSCTGNAATATQATNAINCKTTSVSNSTEYFGVFVDSNGNGFQDLHVGAGLRYNPSTDVLTSGKISSDTVSIVENAKTDAACMTITGAGAGNEANIALKVQGTAHGDPVKLKIKGESTEGNEVGKGLLSFDPDSDTFSIGQSSSHNQMAMSINNSDVVAFKNMPTFPAGIDITGTTDATDATGDTGMLRCEGGASIAKKLYVGSTITGSADVIAYSDERLKKNVKTLDGKKVLEMRGVSFERTDSGKQSSGVIAQELEKVAPELVIDDGSYKGVAYGNVVGYLIEAIKDQQKQIDELKAMCNGCSK